MLRPCCSRLHASTEPTSVNPAKKSRTSYRCIRKIREGSGSEQCTGSHRPRMPASRRNGCRRSCRRNGRRLCGEERAVKSYHLTQRQINALLGTDLTKEQMLGYLQVRLNWNMMRQTNEIVAPTFRQDLPPSGRSWLRKWQDSSDMTIFRPHFRAERLRQVNCLTSCVLKRWQEISQSSADSARVCLIPSRARRYLTNYCFRRIPSFVRQSRSRNPLGEDYSVMRTTSLNGMLTSLATNYNRRNKNVRLIRTGKCISAKGTSVDRTCRMSECSSLWVCTEKAISSA